MNTASVKTPSHFHGDPEWDKEYRNLLDDAGPGEDADAVLVRRIKAAQALQMREALLMAAIQAQAQDPPPMLTQEQVVTLRGLLPRSA